MDSKNTDRKTNTDSDKRAEGWEIKHTKGGFSGENKKIKTTNVNTMFQSREKV